MSYYPGTVNEQERLRFKQDWHQLLHQIGHAQGDWQEPQHMQVTLPGGQGRLEESKSDAASIYVGIATVQSHGSDNTSPKSEELPLLGKNSHFRLEKSRVRLVKCVADMKSVALYTSPISSTAALLKTEALAYGQPPTQELPNYEQATAQVYFRPMRLAKFDSWFHHDDIHPTSTFNLPYRLDIFELAFHQPFTALNVDLWGIFCDRLRLQPGCQTVYWGLQEENTRAVTVFMRNSGLKMKF